MTNLTLIGWPAWVLLFSLRPPLAWCCFSLSGGDSVLVVLLSSSCFWGVLFDLPVSPCGWCCFFCVEGGGEEGLLGCFLPPQKDPKREISGGHFRPQVLIEALLSHLLGRSSQAINSLSSSPSPSSSLPLRLLSAHLRTTSPPPLPPPSGGPFDRTGLLHEFKCWSSGRALNI